MHYLYKITFEEVPNFYIGVRKCPSKKTPLTDKYLGSPVHNKHYWEIYTPKKQVFAEFEDKLEAYSVEISLIRQNWDNKYCLNRCAGNAIHDEILSANGKAVASVWVEMVNSDPNLRHWRDENARKTLIEYHLRRQSDITENAKFISQCKANGLQTGATNIALHNAKKDTDEYKRVRQENGRKRKGTMWVTDGQNETTIPEEKLENYQTNGWWRGRKPKNA